MGWRITQVSRLGSSYALFLERENGTTAAAVLTGAAKLVHCSHPGAQAWLEREHGLDELFQRRAA